MRKLSALLLALVLVLGASVTAYAHPVPDLSKKGTITVTFDLPEDLKSYGSLTLYRVGDVKEDDGNYSFAPVKRLEGAGFSYADPNSRELAEELAEHLKSHPMTGTTRSILWNKDKASVSFTKLELGLYLAVQNKAATGYEKAAPFLISIPYVENGAYRYSLTAQAKSELKKAPTEPPTEATKAPPPPGSLPQTGQLNWPVPVLAVLGMLLFAAGWMLRFKGKRSEDGEEA